METRDLIHKFFLHIVKENIAFVTKGSIFIIGSMVETVYGKQYKKITFQEFKDKVDEFYEMHRKEISANCLTTDSNEYKFDDFYDYVKENCHTDHHGAMRFDQHSRKFQTFRKMVSLAKIPKSDYVLSDIITTELNFNRNLLKFAFVGMPDEEEMMHVLDEFEKVVKRRALYIS